MNILHISDQISQIYGGGAAVVPYQLAKAQAKLGHKVTIFTSDYNSKNQISPEGVEVKKFKGVLDSNPGLRINPGWFFQDYLDYDIMHIHNYRLVGNLIVSFSGLPFVVQALGNAIPINGRMKFAHQLVWPNLLLKRAGRCLALTQTEIDQYLLEGIKPSKISIIPVGIDPGEYENLPVRNANGCKTILYLGRIDHIKGIDMLICAFESLNRKDVRLIIAGPDYGFEKAAVQKVHELKLDDKVFFAGPLGGRDKLQAYVNADLFVLPSRYEAWGLTLMEALACGTPVLTTDRCAIANLIKDNHPLGMAVPFDELQLAGAMSQMLRYNFASSYRDYRREWVKQYSWDVIAKESIKVYKEVLTERCYL